MKVLKTSDTLSVALDLVHVELEPTGSQPSRLNNQKVKKSVVFIYIYILDKSKLLQKNI